ncbi:hypothetical protein PHISCL_03010 [Aspergillus sclerotialis]|uniref:Uncharacterized protein n=1 Tax=Aspergillus sclerotialis TaxID=2070753 RepID=A0A3A2ZZ38_9EURO|nr:hypothetical protein PHISCL_03010 [Aspergillus sclerotialis]
MISSAFYAHMYADKHSLGSVHGNNLCTLLAVCVRDGLAYIGPVNGFVSGGEEPWREKSEGKNTDGKNAKVI